MLFLNNTIIFTLIVCESIPPKNRDRVRKFFMIPDYIYEVCVGVGGEGENKAAVKVDISIIYTDTMEMICFNKRKNF